MNTRARFLWSLVVVGGSVVQLASAAPHRFAPSVPNGRPRNLGARSAAEEAGARGRQFGGGRGGGVREDVPLTEQFDVNKDGWLNPTERRAAREFAETSGLNRGRGGRGAGVFEPSPGPRLSPARVTIYPATVPFFEPWALRTLFLTFDNNDWERELMAFKPTDVRVPATLVMDGQTYPQVGVQFHGNSSFSGVPAGMKHSIHIAMDAIRPGQTLGGFSSFTLLNAHEDPTLLRTVLYLHVARQYLPAPRANFVRVVINGESWGIYPNQEQFSGTLIKSWFKTSGGSRWKVPGSPGSRSSGLVYLGDQIEMYKRVYEIKSKDDPKAWAALVNLTRVLQETPPARLGVALAKILDVDGALRFLAVDNALVNNDGYWTRASDYSLYLDPSGCFHVLPYDANETFATRGGGGRGFGGGDAGLDPLVAAGDPSKPLISKLLAVPAWRRQYLAYTREIAAKWLDWNTLGPVAAKYHALIRPDVATDGRKLSGTEEFEIGLSTLETFAARRREVLLNHTGE